MAYRLEDYEPIIGSHRVFEIYHAARYLRNKTIVHFNSTYYGGGVAEILSALVPLMNDAGIEAGWRMVRGSPDFFSITKKFHNALQGSDIDLTAMKKKVYLQAIEDFSTYNHINHDCVIVHDPQPLPLIKHYRKRQPWIWRVHVDLSKPNQELWDFLKRFILRYDIVIVSNDNYRHDDLPVEQRVVYPAIDPLSSKNIELPEKTIEKYLKRFNVTTKKPLLVQISRFDKWKDPEGVIEVFKIVKEEIDCQLVLCGSAATDDPESGDVYERVKRRANSYIKSGDIVLITYENNILVNALQKSASVIIQKSLREGFGLTVTEALWKSKPVVASMIGGIPVQIENEKSGFLVEPTDNREFARRIIQLLKDPKLCAELGEKGKQKVKEHFLITRLLKDYTDLVKEVIG